MRASARSPTPSASDARCASRRSSAAAQPEIIGCNREGASTIERLTSGVLLCATTYLLILAVPMGSDFDP